MSAVLQNAPETTSHDTTVAAAHQQRYARIDVRPLTGTIGAEIHGVDLAAGIDDDTFAEIRKAFEEHLVVYFPGQDISDEQHAVFSRRFGALMRLPQLYSVEGQEDVQMIRREAAATGRVVGENWHTDSTWMEKPPELVIMRAVDVPAYGGDTGFLSMYAAYEALSPTMQETLGRLGAVHSATRIFGSAYNKSNGKKFDAASAKQDIDESLGEIENVHPIVCTHPRTGRKFLYVNRVYVQRIHGMTEAESKPILEFLYDHTSKFEYTCRVRWQNNQLLMWDNRASMHKAISDYPGKFRFLVRTTWRGRAAQ